MNQKRKQRKFNISYLLNLLNWQYRRLNRKTKPKRSKDFGPCIGSYICQAVKQGPYNHSFESLESSEKY